MAGPSWMQRANQPDGEAPEAPPRSGRGSGTQAWREYATRRGYPVPDDANRGDIIAMVDGGPPPPRPRGAPRQLEGAVYEATVAAVEAATYLTASDRGAVQVLLDLARTIDGLAGRPNANDNVTVPTYLKYSEALALTPLSRLKLNRKETRSGSKLAQLRSIQGGKAS